MNRLPVGLFCHLLLAAIISYTSLRSQNDVGGLWVDFFFLGVKYMFSNITHLQPFIIVVTTLILLFPPKIQ